MFKKYLPIIIINVAFLSIITGIMIYFLINHENPADNNNTPIEIPKEDITVENNGTTNSNLNLPAEGNDTIIKTKVDTTIRVVNEYSTDFFTAKKNLLIMFASWCPNCQEEINEIEKILNRYKNNKNVNIVLIAHEFEDTVTDLIDLIENDVNFGNVEVKIDLKRVIRKKLDPEASTIPISYVVDKKGNVLEKYDESLTLNKVIEMIEK